MDRLRRPFASQVCALLFARSRHVRITHSDGEFARYLDVEKCREKTEKNAGEFKQGIHIP